MSGWWRATEGNFDAVILDIMLPGRNGYVLCRDLRAAGNWVPILMLTAKDGELDEAEGLDTGADDYLTKPFAFPVLLVIMLFIGLFLLAISMNEYIDPRSRLSRLGGQA